MNNASQYKEIRFDRVHDCQRIFKKLMMATAFPGSIHQLLPHFLSNAPKPYGCLLQPLFTLLDIETTYYIHTIDPKKRQDIETYLAMNTTSVPCGPETADFILCVEPSAKKIFTSLKKGTLFSPDQGASIVYHAEEIQLASDIDDASFSLTGPGIKQMVSLKIQGLDQDEPDLWRASRFDYPMGIDIFIVSLSGDVIGIPRSVNIIKPGVK